MKPLLSLFALLLLVPCVVAELRITGTTRVKAHRMVRLVPEGVPPGSALLWRWDKKALDGGRNGNALWLVGPPGEYVIELLALRLDKEGNTSLDEASVTIHIEGDAPITKPTPRTALGRLRVGTSGCTATIIGPRRPDGRWDVLSASHCLPRGHTTGSFTLPDGRSFALTLVHRDATSDLAWFVTDERPTSLPYAVLAPRVPAVGTPIWHAGFGTDRPGNLESGRVLAGENTSRQLALLLNVSPGDSGGGIFREDTGEVIAVVCCTRSIGRTATMFGGSSVRALELRPTPASLSCERPVLDLSRFDWDGKEKK